MIRVGFLWHMHQPSYVDPATGVSVLPWVRLHATRAYYDMIRVARQYPRVHTTYNLVPALILQLQTLSQGGQDRFRQVARKSADDLDELEARFLIDMFFQVDWETQVKPQPGYRRLLELRGGAYVDPDVLSAFRVQDLRDLQVWFNLAWFGFTALKEYPALQSLKQKGQGFGEDDKAEIFRIQDEILGRIIGLYAEAWREGIVELTTTPFYHPILPLLCDTDAAGRAQPDIRLLSPPFRYEKDAREQISRAVAYFTRVFGKAPEGMWPSEGSVSPEVVPLMQEAGLRWFATSEGILHHSELESGSRPPQLDAQRRPSVLSPYQVGDMAVFFRHLEISDRIGFNYGRLPGQEAVDDLLGRIRGAAAGFREIDGPPFVPIILDGENPWEHYWDGGESFLHQLYQGLLGADDLEGLSFSEYLKEYPPATRVKKLWSGSWIASNFSIWAGHAEDRAGWALLRDARAFLAAAEDAEPPPAPEALEAARRSVFAAEGSDWFWWYGDEFSSQADHEFDRLFRAHVAGVYEALGHAAPREVTVPIKGIGKARRLKPPRAIVRVLVDGQDTTFYEWADAGEVRLEASGGTMARGSRLLRKLAYGFDEKNIYLRVDFGQDVLELEQLKPELDLMIVAPHPMSARFPIQGAEPMHVGATSLRTRGLEGSMPSAAPQLPGVSSPGLDVSPGLEPPDTPGSATGEGTISVAGRDVLEIAIPRDLVHLAGHGTLEFFLLLLAEGRELLRYPAREVFELEVPAADRLAEYWRY